MDPNTTIDDFFKRKESGEKSKRVKKVKTAKSKEKGFPVKKMGGFFHGSLKQEKPNVIEEVYPGKYTVLSAVRAVFWLLIGVVIIRGISAWTSPVRPIIYKEEYIRAPSESDTAKAFALQFVREYLSYDARDQSEYRRRIGKYLAYNVSPDTVSGWSRVLESNLWAFKKLNEKNSVITVHVKLMQGKNAEDPGTIRERYVKVPVMALESEQYQVRDYPVFAAEFDSSKGHAPSFSGNSATERTRKEITETLTNFFKIYDRGTPEQIAYFLKSSEKVKGYGGSYTFDMITSLEIYKQNSDETQAFVIAEIVVLDDFGSRFRQKYNFQMVREIIKNETRWYISDFIEVGQNY